MNKQSLPFVQKTMNYAKAMTTYNQVPIIVFMRIKIILIKTIVIMKITQMNKKIKLKYNLIIIAKMVVIIRI